MFERVQSDFVSADIVVDVGHIAPVRFSLNEDGTRFAEPYSIPAWTPEECSVEVPAVKWLRGEFFGFPFGQSEGFEHVHGPAANGPWTLGERTDKSVRMTVDLPKLSGQIEKHVSLRDGHRALYLEHTVTGVEGRFNYGHHPVLEVPEGENVEIRLNPFKYGSVFPNAFGDASGGDIAVLQEGGRFTALDSLPLKDGGTMSVEHYPTSVQHEDLVMMSAADDVELGWTAVSFDGYVWISLRSVKQFPSTLFWLSNGGCLQEPWCGVNGRRIGVEDVCSYFSLGAEHSREEPLAELGIETSKQFSAEKATVLRHIQMVHPTIGKQAVVSVLPLAGVDKVIIKFDSGQALEADLDWRWLLNPDLEK